MWTPALADSERIAPKRADCVGASMRSVGQVLTQCKAYRIKLRLHTGRLSAGQVEPSVIALHNAHDDRDASGPPLASRNRNREARARARSLQVRCIRRVCILERRDAREGSYASEARTARGRQGFERMNGGIVGGFGCRCQAKSFVDAMKCR